MDGESTETHRGSDIEYSSAPVVTGGGVVEQRETCLSAAGRPEIWDKNTFN